MNSTKTILSHVEGQWICSIRTPRKPRPFEFERLSEFVPKLAHQPIMIHFRSASGLCLPLQEHKPGSFAARIPLHETSLFRYLTFQGRGAFQKLNRVLLHLAQILLIENLIPNGNFYFIEKALRPGLENAGTLSALCALTKIQGRKRRFRS